MLRFLDGFDHYATADITLKWTTSGNAGSLSIGSANARTGSCLKIAGGGTGWAWVKKVLDAQATWIVGCAFQVDFVGKTYPILQILDAGSVQVYLGVNADQTLSAYRGSTLLATSTLALSPNVYYYIELKATIDGAAGTVQVHVSGNTAINFTGNTKATANATANQILVGIQQTQSVAGLGNIYYDDSYIADGQGTANNTFLGDVKVETLYPTGAGTNTSFTPNGAASNWDCVNDNPEDGDTSYVATSGVLNVDTYTLGDLSSAPSSIAGIQTNILARKDDAGTRTIAAVVRSAGADYAGSASFGLADGYTLMTEVRETDPATGSAWTGAGIDAMEAGVKLVG